MEWTGEGEDVVFCDRRGGLKAKCGRLWGADCGMEVSGPGAGPGGETIANGHGGNSTGHGSADHMLIGGLVAECLILKALRSDTQVGRFLAVKIRIFAGKALEDQLPSSSLFSMLV